MNGPDGGHRLLLVHAHPDDESIGTGATMAKYAAEGAGVTLVTCTLGELGEVIPPELAHLATDGGLGEYRIGELAAACAALGVTDHRFLGGPGRWRDSGMMGLPSNDAPGCFWQADVDEPAGELLAVIREVRPQVLISYDDNGFYGHPDHIQAHRVAWRAFQLAGDPGLPVPGLPGVPSVSGRWDPWPVPKFYATAVPRSVLAAATDLPGRDGVVPPVRFIAEPAAETVPFGAADDEVSTEIDGSAYLGAKTAAMRAHATQITVHEPFFALSNWVGQRILAREYYTLLAGPRGPAGPAARETDLFAGLG